MSEILFHYEKVAATTWAYLSSLLIIGLFFKFGRFWSVRNLDLVLLILLAPGLLLVQKGQDIQTEAWLELAAARAQDEAARTVEPWELDPLGSEADTRVDPPASGDDSDGETRPAGEADEGATAGEAAADDGDDAAESLAVVAATLEATMRNGRSIERVGFIWLLAAGLLLLIRLLLDSTMVRRPLLDPNLSTGALAFIGVSLFVFLMANVIIGKPSLDDLRGPMHAEQLLQGRAASSDTDRLNRHGPGYALFFLLPSLQTASMPANVDRAVDKDPVRLRIWEILPEGQTEGQTEGRGERVTAGFVQFTDDGGVRLRTPAGEDLEVDRSRLGERDQQFVVKLGIYTSIARWTAILSHLAIVAGLVAVGYWHFNNTSMGVGAAALYLMLPYTSQLTGRVDHVLPAALLVWAVLCYRRPLSAGIFMGLATGLVYYPLFLLPLWVSFYWQRGLGRFAIGVVSMLLVMVVLLMVFSGSAAAFWHNLQGMLGLMPPQLEGLTGIWGLGWPPVYRYPVLAAFVALSGTLALWPAQKNLGTLLSCSAAVMVATQFWHGYGGGVYLAWYLPLFLLTIFRPNLEDRVAMTVLGEGWLSRRRRVPSSHVDIAA